jgi:hypothetical protein
MGVAQSRDRTWQNLEVIQQILEAICALKYIPRHPNSAHFSDTTRSFVLWSSRASNKKVNLQSSTFPERL